MKIEVIGAGCARCVMLMKLVHQAVSELGIKADVSKVDGIEDIVNYGVMMTPALAVNGKVKFSGKVPGLDDLKKIIKDNA